MIAQDAVGVLEMWGDVAPHVPVAAEPMSEHERLSRGLPADRDSVARNWIHLRGTLSRTPVRAGSAPIWCPGGIFGYSADMARSAQVELTVRSAQDLAAARAAIIRLAAHTTIAVDDAVLAANELVTNALLYTAGPCVVAGWLTAPRGALRVEVRDPSASMLPPVRPATPDAHSGRGLAIVQQLASRWGVQPNERDGKTVWFEIDQR
jgi:Histidine kinase-like ATPase domain